MRKLLSILAAFSAVQFLYAEDINISTENTKLVLERKADGLLTSRGYGMAGDEFAPIKRTDELVQQFLFYPTSGDGFLGDSSLRVVHADGDIATRLEVVGVKSATDSNDSNIVDTEISLKDPAHEFYVKLFFRAYKKQDIIQIWSKIENRENGGIRLGKFASASLFAKRKGYYLTQFSGSYAREFNLAEEKLTRGRKVLESNLGARAHRMLAPMFMVSDKPASEDSGRVMGGAFMWSGSFNMRFDIDTTDVLRMTLAADNIGGEYYLAKGEIMETPKTLWSCTDSGAAALTHNFHAWARAYGMRSPQTPRPVLLNNWEATYMKFDEQKLVSLFEHAKGLGIDVFLLDDGWFGDKYVRNRDTSSLGDWVVAKDKLPHGIGYLCAEAQKRGMDFGIWLEPEMISPKSELFEKHPDWAMCSKNRAYVLGRQQLVLDLTNPEVLDFTKKIFADIVRPYPVKYVKWDANCCIYQPFSAYLPAEKKGNAIFDYNKNLLALMRHFSTEYPEVGAMLCSGGGGRVDYASLANFYSFWPSDNTDPYSRLKIQWMYMYFYPQNTVSAHVTKMGGRPFKFATDVAMSGVLGYDIDISKVPDANKAYMKRTIGIYKSKIRPITSNGRYYRLMSPFDGTRSALMTVDGGKAVVFVYSTGDSPASTLKLKGLSPDKSYKIAEVGLYEDGAKSAFPEHGKTLRGQSLTENGLSIPAQKKFESAVILLEETK